MASAGAENQAANLVPPREGAIFAITLDATSRPKDLGNLALGGVAIAKGGSVYLTLRANVKWWYRFSPVNTGTINEATADAATLGATTDGTSPNTFPATAAIEVSADEFVHVRVDRLVDRFLLVKGSGAGILRGWASSDRSGSAS